MSFLEGQRAASIKAPARSTRGVTFLCAAVAIGLLTAACGGNSESEADVAAEQVVVDNDAPDGTGSTTSSSLTETTSPTTTQVATSTTVADMTTTTTAEPRTTEPTSTTTQPSVPEVESDVARLERELAETQQRLAALEEAQAQDELDTEAVERALREAERRREEEERQRDQQRQADEPQRTQDCQNVEYWNWPFPRAVWPTGWASTRVGADSGLSGTMSQSVVIGEPIAQPSSTSSWDGRWTQTWNDYWARNGYTFGDPPLPRASDVKHESVRQEKSTFWRSARLVVPPDEWICWQMYEQQPRPTCRWVSMGDGSSVQRCD